MLVSLPSLGTLTTFRSFDDIKRRFVNVLAVTADTTATTAAATVATAKEIQARISLQLDKHVKKNTASSQLGDQGKRHVEVPTASMIGAMALKKVSRAVVAAGLRPAYQHEGGGSGSPVSGFIPGTVSVTTSPTEAEKGQRRSYVTTKDKVEDDTCTISSGGHDSSNPSLSRRDTSPDDASVRTHRTTSPRTTKAAESQGFCLKDRPLLLEQEIQDDTVAHPSASRPPISANVPGRLESAVSSPVTLMKAAATATSKKEENAVDGVVTPWTFRRNQRTQEGKDGLAVSLTQENGAEITAPLTSFAHLDNKMPGPAVRRFLGVVPIVCVTGQNLAGLIFCL